MGRKFDLNANWTSPHAEHDRGSAIDMSTVAGQCPNNMVIQDPQGMSRACYAEGAADVIIHTATHLPPAHIHCNFQSIATFPH
jgi:hypothetical protein